MAKHKKSIIVSVEHKNDITELLEDNGLQPQVYGFGDDGNGRGDFYDWCFWPKSMKKAEKLCSRLAELGLEFEVMNA